MNVVTQMVAGCSGDDGRVVAVVGAGGDADIFTRNIGSYKGQRLTGGDIDWRVREGKGRLRPKAISVMDKLHNIHHRQGELSSFTNCPRQLIFKGESQPDEQSSTRRLRSY